MTSAKKARLAGGICIAGATGVAAAAVALLGPAAFGATKAGGDSTGMVLSIRAAIRARAPVNTEEFWKKKIEDIPVDEVFFHRYFNQKGAALKSKSKPEWRKLPDFIKSRRSIGSNGRMRSDERPLESPPPSPQATATPRPHRNSGTGC